eukprot:5544019-Prymnesium_polylepis.1
MPGLRFWRVARGMFCARIQLLPTRRRMSPCPSICGCMLQPVALHRTRSPSPGRTFSFGGAKLILYLRPRPPTRPSVRG